MQGHRLSGKVAIVTGGGAGIGEAICKTFALEGASIVVNGLSEDPIDDVVADIVDAGGRAVAYPGDVSYEEHAHACIGMALATYGKLDILINNAGVLLANADTSQMPADVFDEHLRSNLRTAFLMTKYALPYLRETRGNIITAGCESGFNGQPRNTAYGGTKGFLHAFMQGVAVEQARFGVRANCICPGAIDTAWTHKESGVVDEETENAMINATPLGRRGTVEEVANVYLFLASDEASYVTGALWLVDGGLTPAKGAMGAAAGPAAKTPPLTHLDLQHTHDGMRNKRVVKA